MTTLLPNKFYPPPIPNGYVPRPHLLAELDDALTHRLMLVSAPAGEVREEAIGIAETYQRRNARPLTASASVYAPMSRVLTETGEFEKAIQTSRKAMALSEQWAQWGRKKGTRIGPAGIVSQHPIRKVILPVRFGGFFVSPTLGDDRK